MCGSLTQLAHLCLLKTLNCSEVVFTLSLPPLLVKTKKQTFLCRMDSETQKVFIVWDEWGLWRRLWAEGRQLLDKESGRVSGAKWRKHRKHMSREWWELGSSTLQGGALRRETGEYRADSHTTGARRGQTSESESDIQVKQSHPNTDVGYSQTENVSLYRIKCRN